MSPGAVVFDLDDTLIDWWGSIERCLAEFAGDEVIGALQRHCRAALWELRPGSTDVWHRNTWALHTSRERIWPAALDFLDPTEIELLARRFDEELWVGFFPEVVPTLDMLVDTHRLAVLSNNQFLPQEALRLRLADWFEVAVAADPDRYKPDPAAFELVAGQLDLPTERCVYIGDSARVDALGAHAAGMTAVWLNRWADAWPDRPHEIHQISTLAELPALLDLLASGVH